MRQHESEAIQQLFLQQGGHDHVYYERYMPTRTQTTSVRRLVYEYRMYALPLTDSAGRERECSAEFYRENPAQIHRLMPWVSREIMVLSNNITHRAEFIISIIQNILPEYDISSQRFFDLLEPHLLDRTRHFVHEFLVFARSPYDMYGYDRYIRYQQGYNPVNEDSTVEIPTSSSDEDDVRVVTTRGRTEFTIETRSNLSTVILMGSLERVNNGNNNNSNSNENNNNEGDSIVINEENEDVTLNNNTANGNNRNSNNEINTEAISRSPVIESLLTDSDSDDCFFVREQKPPHLRTPELVVLNSNDEDSDVVFVDESLPSTSSNSTENLPPKKRKCFDDESLTHLNGVELKPNISEPSTSSSTWTNLKENEIPDNIEYKVFSNIQPSTSSAQYRSTENQMESQNKKLYCPPIRLYKTNIRNRKRIYESPSSSSHDVSTESSSELSTSSHEEFTIYSTSKQKTSRKKNGRRYNYTTERPENSTNVDNNLPVIPSTSSSSSSSRIKTQQKKSKKKSKKLKSAVVKPTKYSDSDSDNDQKSMASNNSSLSSEKPLSLLLNKKKSNSNHFDHYNNHNWSSRNNRFKSKKYISSSSDDSS